MITANIILPCECVSYAAQDADADFTADVWESDPLQIVLNPSSTHILAWDAQNMEEILILIAMNVMATS